MRQIDASIAPLSSRELPRVLNEQREVYSNPVRQETVAIVAPQRAIVSRTLDTRLYQRGPILRQFMAGLRAPLRWLNSPGSLVRTRTVIQEGQGVESQFVVARAPRPSEAITGITCDDGLRRGF